MSKLRRIILLLIAGACLSWVMALGIALSWQNFPFGYSTRVEQFDAESMPAGLRVLQGKQLRLKGRWYRRWPDYSQLTYRESRSLGLMLRTWGPAVSDAHLPSRPQPPRTRLHFGLWWAFSLEPAERWGALSRAEVGESILQTGEPYRGTDHAFGLPFLCLSHEINEVFGPTPVSRTKYAVSGGITLTKTTFPNPPLVLPYCPLWRGILANTIFFATAIPLTRYLIGMPRRVYRFNRGRCPRCAYDLAHDYRSGCPECGWRRETEPAPAQQPKPS